MTSNGASPAGLRDHSWGPRDWAGPRYYRWITATFDDGSAAMGMKLADRNGRVRNSALMHAEGQTTKVSLAALDTSWTDDHYQNHVAMTVTTTVGDVLITGRAPNGPWIPLRHRRDDTNGTNCSRESHTPQSYSISRDDPGPDSSKPWTK